MAQYLFVRLYDNQVNVRMSGDLDEFENFCHYCGLDYIPEKCWLLKAATKDEWKALKEEIQECLDNSGMYNFSRDFIEYYILQHLMWLPCWDLDEKDEFAKNLEVEIIDEGLLVQKEKMEKERLEIEEVWGSLASVSDKINPVQAE